MSRRLVTMITGGVMLVLLGVFGARLPVPYAALGPGPTLDTLGSVNNQQIISVSGRRPNAVAGHLNLTTVSVTDHLDLFSALRGWFDGEVAVVPREELFPPNQTPQQVDEQNARDFAQSESDAVVAALRELHFPEKVVVQDLAEDDSPSKGKLKTGDALEKVDGVAVPDLAALEKVLTGSVPGTTVTVDYVRARKPASTKVTLAKAAKRQGGALGVLVAMNPVAPYDVDIKVGEDIGGPSAGLMFALGILEKVGPTELTGGRFIAGTGTIDFAGKVGPIGGIQLKMISAREHGATVFLVPKGNCTDALQRPPSGLELVKVETLHGAVDALHALESGRTAPTC
jgi:PDZ domain-containing protein